MASSTPPPPVLSGACWPDPDPSPSKPILADDVTRMNAVAVVSGRLGKEGWWELQVGAETVLI